MKDKTNMSSNLIAPCGMNCGICMAYLQDKNKCVSCNADQPQKPKHCLVCSIKTCNQKEATLFCFQCQKYPCYRLRQLDKRYRTKYGMSMVENLNHIRDNGLDHFMVEENTRWVCRECGNPICIHNKRCYACGKQYEP